MSDEHLDPKAAFEAYMREGSEEREPTPTGNEEVLLKYQRFCRRVAEELFGTDAWMIEFKRTPTDPAFPPGVQQGKMIGPAQMMIELNEEVQRRLQAGEFDTLFNEPLD